MTKDLEATLSEMDGAHRRMVRRMQSAFAPAPLRYASRAVLSAAALMLVASLWAVFALWEGGVSPSPHLSAFRLADDGGEEAIGEIIRTQNADGSWQTDFLTRQNARVLAGIRSGAASLAYRKAVRNLRARGIN